MSGRAIGSVGSAAEEAGTGAVAVGGGPIVAGLEGQADPTVGPVLRNPTMPAMRDALALSYETVVYIDSDCIFLDQSTSVGASTPSAARRFGRPLSFVVATSFCHTAASLPLRRSVA